MCDWPPTTTHVTVALQESKHEAYSSARTVAFMYEMLLLIIVGLVITMCCVLPCFT